MLDFYIERSFGWRWWPEVSQHAGPLESRQVRVKWLRWEFCFLLAW